jgi:hypothetical protein
MIDSGLWVLGEAKQNNGSDSPVCMVSMTGSSLLDYNNNRKRKHFDETTRELARSIVIFSSIPQASPIIHDDGRENTIRTTAEIFIISSIYLL